VKIVMAFLIGLLIGISCRWFKIPVPAPPTLIGALLVLSITVGYIVTDYLMSRREAPGEPEQVRVDSNTPGSSS
jgi:XapX domain-containing protein